MEMHMTAITGLSHVAMKVADLDGAVAFYCDGLGMALRHHSPGAAIVASPDGVMLEIFAGCKRVANRSGFTHFCLDTFDADAAFRRALSCGAVASRGEPYDLGDLRIAFVTAPTGEEVEFWHFRGAGGGPAPSDQYVRGFVHAALTVPDMDACVRFYEGLGARFKTGWGWGCSMKLADGRELELFTGGDICDVSSGITHVCFETGDADAALARAVSLGGVLADAPKEWENIRYAFFRGLAGERVELVQYLPGKSPNFFEPASPFGTAF